MMKANRRKAPPRTEADLEAIKYYYRRLAESNGFDIEGLVIPKGVVPLREISLRSYGAKVKLYARMGLHRYNMLFGKNLELSGIKRFNKRCMTPAYYCITLDAFDPSTPSEKMVFEVKVYEERIRPLHLRCNIARPQGTKQSSASTCHCHFYDVGLPEWPSSEDAFQDTERFYELKESELQEHSWISLYMELAFQNQTSTLNYKDFSRLHIVKAVIETKEPLESPEERLKAKHATVYIWFINMFTPRIRMRRRPRSCKVIVTRDLDDSTGELFLRSTGWVEEEADDATISLMLRTSGCPDESQPVRFSTRKRKPIQMFMS